MFTTYESFSGMGRDAVMDELIKQLNVNSYYRKTKTVSVTKSELKHLDGRTVYDLTLSNKDIIRVEVSPTHATVRHMDELVYSRAIKDVNDVVSWVGRYYRKLIASKGASLLD